MGTINHLFQGGGELEIRLIPNPENAKSDAALLLMHGPERLDAYLIDGGLANGCTLEAVLALRRRLLAEAQLEDSEENRLALTLLVTHCHVDHVAELYKNLIPCPYVAIDALYLPPATALATDGAYNNTRNGDLMHRPRILSALMDHAPQAALYTLAYGETRTLPLPGGCLRLFAPDRDWGAPAGVDYVLRHYMADAPAERVFSNMPVRVLNCNCMWIQAEVGGHSMLFPGDAVKKLPQRDDESLDCMLAAYGELLRSDVVKYPHHGVKRNEAASMVASELRKGNGPAVLACSDAEKEAAPILDALGVPHMNLADGTQVFVLSAEGVQYIQP